MEWVLNGVKQEIELTTEGRTRGETTNERGESKLSAGAGETALVVAVILTESVANKVLCTESQ